MIRLWPLVLAAALSGCAVVSVVDTTVSVAASAVETTVDVSTGVVGAGVDLVTEDEDD